MRHVRTWTETGPPTATGRRHRLLVTAAIAGCLSVTAALTLPVVAGAMPPPNPPSSFLSHFSTVTNVASTVPANGDVNPYGITVVPQSVGKLVSGDTLVSNFNNSANLQGTGTTIVQVSPWGSVTTFAQLGGPLPGACPGVSASPPRSPHSPVAGSWWGACPPPTGCRTQPGPGA